jgi:hypothetical protein
MECQKVNLQHHCKRCDIEGDHGKKNEKWIRQKIFHGRDYFCVIANSGWKLIFAYIEQKRLNYGQRISNTPPSGGVEM